MTTTTTRWRRTRVAVVLLTVGALAGTVACGTQAAPSQPQASAGAVSVNCGPGLQAVIHPSTVNGQAVSQVDCVPAMPMAASQPQQVAPAPVAPVPAISEPVSYRPARAVAANDYVEYQPRVIQHRTWKPRRSVQKSAVIIGSSAGIGAAIGGAINGGKGALIGAALGGGGAALWDQSTRH